MTILAGGRLAEPGPRGHVLGPPVDVVLDGGSIGELRPHDLASLAAPGAVDARGLLVLPGLVNGHTHSHEILQRGRYAKAPLEVWMHYLRPPVPAYRLTPEETYTRTLLAAAEALRGGATTVVDDVNLFPRADEETVDALFRAYEDSGLRAFVGVSLFDRQYFRAVPFVDEELPADVLAELSRVPAPATHDVLSLARHMVARRGRVSACLAPSAPQRCTDELLVELAALAREEEVPALVHVNETRLQAVTAQRLYGCTMVEHLHALGFLAPHVSLIHAVWLTPRDIELLAATGATAQHNPTSNLRLGSGLAPVRALLRAGVNVSLGTDGCGSCVAASMRDGVRQAALLGSLRGDDEWLSAAEALELATAGGARALGLDDVGRIERGFRADVCLYRLDGIAFAPLNDPLRQWAYAEQDAALDTVVVDGRVVMRGGRIMAFDEARALDDARALHERLLPAIEQSDAFVDGLRPAYERIHRRALAEAVPAETTVGAPGGVVSEEPLHWWPARALAAAIRRREVSAVAVMRAHLDRIAAVNPSVNAIVSPLPEADALAAARRADEAAARGEELGPLHGLPTAVKDLMDVAGLPTSHGSRAHAGGEATRDAVLVERLRTAGAIVIGKTNTPEAGLGTLTFNDVFGVTRNPWDLSRHAGGSSGGAAAAVAAGMLPVADGSDSGGSIRYPAAFCNVVGLRPSAGRVPSGRAGNAWDPHGVLGPIARDSCDAGLLLSAIAGLDDRWPLALEGDPRAFEDVRPRELVGLRVGWSDDAGGLPIDPEVQAVHAAAREALTALGCVVQDVELPFEGADDCWEAIEMLGFFSFARDDVARRRDLLRADLVRNVEQGAALSAAELADAYARRTEIHRETAALLRRYDVLGLPATPVPAPPAEVEWVREVDGVPLGRYFEWQRCASRVTVTAHPALVTPAGFTAAGLPVGLQLVGRHRGDYELLAVGAALENALGLVARRPRM